MVSLHVPDANSTWKREQGRGRKRERESQHWGNQSSQWLAPPLLFRKAFYTFGCTQRSTDNTKLCSNSSSDSYWDQAFSLHTQLYTQVLGDLHHLLARRPINILWPFSYKGLSTRKPSCLNSVLLPKFWCHSQKALNKVTFLHSKDTTIYNKEREVQWIITKRKFINSKD